MKDDDTEKKTGAVMMKVRVIQDNVQRNITVIIAGNTTRIKV